MTSWKCIVTIVDDVSNVIKVQSLVTNNTTPSHGAIYGSFDLMPRAAFIRAINSVFLSFDLHGSCRSLSQAVRVAELTLPSCYRYKQHINYYNSSWTTLLSLLRHAWEWRLHATPAQTWSLAANSAMSTLSWTLGFARAFFAFPASVVSACKTTEVSDIYQRRGTIVDTH